MFTVFKMRQNTRQWSFWYILMSICVGLLILKLIHTNVNFLEISTLCDDCVYSESNLYELYRGTLDWHCQRQHFPNHCTGKVVPVPISQVMSGKPVILSQDDKRLVNYIWWNKHIHPPSDNPYNLENPGIDPSRGQGQFIRRILKNMTNGFFVECGALDGETRSNTLFMETQLGWKGLLVEGDPSNFALMKKKNRKAWMANTCLAIKPHPHTANFLQKFNIGKVLNTEEAAAVEDSKYVEVQCMPLYSLLVALNVTTVDYFSLDVEGSELRVLKTIPFDKVYIRTLSVEYIHTSEGKMETIEFMKSHGYKMVGEVHYPNNLANDLMFVHKDVAFDSAN